MHHAPTALCMHGLPLLMIVHLTMAALTISLFVRVVVSAVIAIALTTQQEQQQVEQQQEQYIRMLMHLVTLEVSQC